MLNKKALVLIILSHLLLLCAQFSNLNATVRYVSKTGNSTPPYLTWETAADSIQECINICVFGDTIYVANGVYEEQVVMIQGLALIGAGTDSCVINTQSLVNTIGFVAVDVKDSCLLTGFQIIVYYNNDMGYGVNCHGNCKVILNSIQKAAIGFGLINTGISKPYLYNNNVSEVQKGAFISNSSPLVRRNNISTSYNSAATIIAGIYLNSTSNNYTPIIDSNYIVAINGKGIYKSFGARPIIINNEIITNGTGVQLSASDSAIVNNNSIIVPDGIEAAYGINNISTQYLQLYNNQVSGDYYYGVLYISPYNKIKNNLISNAEGEIEAWGNQNLLYQFNNVWNSNVSYSGFTPDTTNLSVDPMVINDDTTQGKLDFHLQKYSPLIDAGDPTILDKDSTRSDIGLYGGPYGENYIYIDLPPRSPVNLTVNVDSLIELKWNKNTEADFNHYNLYIDTTSNFQIDSTKLIASIADTFYYQIIPSKVESLYFKLTAVDNQGNESNPSEEVGVLITSVKDEWIPVNNYILYQNYPNPFNPSTKIGYKLKERGYVKLYVYDVKGELISVLVNLTQEVGYYEVNFNVGRESIPFLSSGVYIYQILVTGENNIPVFSDIKKMILLR